MQMCLLQECIWEREAVGYRFSVYVIVLCGSTNDAGSKACKRSLLALERPKKNNHVGCSLSWYYKRREKLIRITK